MILLKPIVSFTLFLSHLSILAFVFIFEVLLFPGNIRDIDARFHFP